MSIINTNVISLNAQRNLSTNSASLATTIQRLSSGLRINSARDDAAGLAISERFSTQIRGLNVAARNANDGISLAQTAEGALGEIGSNLQRIRELAVQSSNATNSASDRAALNSEVQQLISEIQRVATQTEFNGTKLLDGSFTGQAFQVGANAGQLITVASITNAQSSILGATNFAADVVGGAVTDAAISGLTINGVTIENVAAQGSVAATAAALAGAINKRVADTGVFAVVNGSNGITLQSLIAGQATVVGGTVTNTGLAAGTTAANTAFQLDDVNISSFAGAQKAIAIVDSALTSVNSARADMGAVQNRFQSVVANLTTSSENLSASRSRIRDADYARETAELTRTQILQQAGTAMLAQANQIPQNVLSLLR
ncbi:MAG: flagellin [Silanimonas sp.]|nr:MAG: flagellin [Silanimonas sp.]